ncbi:MAG: YkgJ family cysteine cluster protein [Azonexus sp.]|nr:YkgJ family cysteine cluster protein [Burkholderiaceae bacterium]MDP3638496.1 YkgJ family cysteine cluster protein [Azonexus sp.]MDZ4314135.1 YkgJ family cysteine cluster protein [Azonexus sp.]
MPETSPLLLLHSEIDQRVQSILENHPDWICGKGCDLCCRRLAEIPPLTTAEWDLLQAGLAALPLSQRQEIGDRVDALAEQTSRPIVCPFLDQNTGACPVYLHRPVACRSYGFYVQRELGLYCHEIESRVAAGTLSDVVWGNHDAIDQRLTRLGESRPLTEWFTAWAQTAGFRI